MSKPTVIIVTASNCGYCKSFRKTWDKVAKQASKIANFEEIPLDDVNSSRIPSSYSNDLASIRPWFPMLLMVNPTDLEAAKRDPNTKMRFVAFNGIAEDGAIKHKPTTERSEDNVVGWIKTNTQRVMNGPPTLQASRPPPARTPKIATPPIEEKKKPFDVKASIFVQTCERNANITPSVRNGGYAPF
jgi:thiol-disulfide isomerase/thioredoxin